MLPLLLQPPTTLIACQRHMQQNVTVCKCVLIVMEHIRLLNPLQEEASPLAQQHLPHVTGDFCVVF